MKAVIWRILKRLPGSSMTRIAILVTALTLCLAPGNFAAAQESGPYALRGTLTEIGKGAGSPDDVAVAADGSIYFGDMTANKVLRLKADGSYEAISPEIREPEGIVPLP